MRNGSVAILMVILVVVSGTFGYFLGASQTTTLTPQIQPHEAMSLVATCNPFGSTGAVIATNTGPIPVNLTNFSITDSNGSNLTTYHPAKLIAIGGYSILSQGIGYVGNVSIRVTSVHGNVWTTTCPPAG